MGMPHSQAAPSKMPVVLVTLGVVAASAMELVLVLVLGYYQLRNYGYSKFDRVQQAQADARRNARNVANRANPAPWLQPNTERDAPPIRNTPLNQTARQASNEGPGTAYAKIDDVQVNDRVHILWEKSWWPGTVIERSGWKAKVHYDNHSDTSDERVDIDRIRKMSPNDPNFKDNSPATVRPVNPSGPGIAYAKIADVQVNDRVHILLDKTWWPGTVIEQNGAKAKVHYDNRTEAWDELVDVDRVRKMSPDDARFNNSQAVTSKDGPGSAYVRIEDVQVNDRVHILWHGSWYPGTVLERRGFLAKIHYDNHDDSWDERVALDRLRKMLPSDPRYRDGSRVAGRPGANNDAPPMDLNPKGHLAPYQPAHQPQDAFPRAWRNRQGEVVFHGQLYGNFGPVVLLIRKSGFTTNTQSVDVTLLSDEDQAYVRRFPVLSPDRPDKPEAPEDPHKRIREEAERRIAEARARIEERRNELEGNNKPPAKAPASDPLKGVRTWEDSTGKFKLEAEFIRVVKGNVELQRPDGKIVTMPIDKLSPADRDAVRAKYPE